MSSKNNELVFENIHYQPTILNNKAWEKIKKLDFNLPDSWIERGERNSLDRAKLLAGDLNQKGTVLDIGCNIGFFTHVLQSLGHKTTGIDNDVHVEVKKFTQTSSIQTAINLNKKYGLNAEFIDGDFVDYLNGTKRTWDYVLFLSVFHHLFIGYGYSDYRKADPADAVRVLQLIDEHTDKNLYFEMDEKVGYPFGWGSEEEVRENIKMFTTFDIIETLDVSKDGWAEGRTLLRCSRSKNNKRVLPKLLSLSSLSRRNRVGCVKDGGLYLSREANDWAAAEHPYGVTVKRQKILESGKVLNILKKNPHPSICEVLDFDKHWVKLEYIDGLLLSSLAPYIQDQNDYLSKNLSISEAVELIKTLSDAINHLHSIGVAHTDPISFNVMIAKDGTPKFIDVIGAVELNDQLKTLDLEVFWKRCAMEIIDRVGYKYLEENSDAKMLELAWGNSKTTQKLLEEGKIKDRKLLKQIEEIIQKDSEIKGFEDLHRSRIIKVAERLVSLSKSTRTNAPRIKNGARRSVVKAVPRPLKRALKHAKKKLLTKRVVFHNEIHDSKTPIVSIVTPFYNSKSTIMQTVNSVLNQTLQDFEYIIVDDGSKKEESEVLKTIKDPRISIIRFEENKGHGSPAAARNAGVRRANGKYIVCLDADDMLEDTFVEKGLIALETHPWLAVFTTDTKAFGRITEEWTYADYNAKELIRNNTIITGAMYKKSAWEEAGGYKEDIGYEDWELWISMAERGLYGMRQPEKLFHYRTATASRYTEDLKKHHKNLRKIENLHPDYLDKIRRLNSSFRRLDRKVSNKTAFTNLSRPEQYAPLSRKSVLVVLPWMTFGGAETLTLNFCNELKKDYDISFVTGIDSENEWEYKFREISPRIYHLDKMFRDRSLWVDFLSNYISTRKVEILHIVHNSFMFEMLSELKIKHPKLKVIFTAFNDRAHFDESLEFVNFIDGFSTDNEYVKSRFLHEMVHLGADVPVSVIPNGINNSEIFVPDEKTRLEIRKQLNIAKEDVASFFIGRLSSEKNPDIFVEAAKLVDRTTPNSRNKFFIIGDGPMNAQIVSSIKRANQPNIIYLGYQSEIPKFLNAADIFVLPSSIEGFPLSVLEAMAMKVAVVASRVGAVPDIITQNQNGIVVSPGSATEIAGSIIDLTNDRDKLDKIKSKSREEVEKKYSNRILGRNYKKLYEGLLK